MYARGRDFLILSITFSMFGFIVAITKAILRGGVSNDNSKGFIYTESKSRVSNDNAITLDNTEKPLQNVSLEVATPFSYGAGHVRPNYAADPGLVYDLNTNDYTNFSIETYQCSESFRLLDFSYPSIVVPNLSGSVTLTRTVKNVGGHGTYHATVDEPNGVFVTVDPKELKFENMGEEKTFKVTLKADNPNQANDYVFGKLTWSDGEHYLRSPIVVNTIVGNSDFVRISDV